MTRSLFARMAATVAAATLVLTTAPAHATPEAPAGQPYSSERTPTQIQRIPGATGQGTPDGLDSENTPAPEAFSGSHAATAFTPCAYDFSDAPPAGSFYAAITWMACKNITAGYSDGSFGKTRQITRGETAQFLYRLSGENHSPGIKRDFKDVNPGGAGFTAISWMQAKGYSAGYANGAFGINDPITRGELASFMYRMGGSVKAEVPTKTPFTDMKTTTPFYNGAAWLKGTGMVGGYADGTFRPKRSITRGETAAFLYALETYLHGKPAPPKVAPKPYPKPAAPVSTTSMWTKVSSGLYQQGDYGSKTLTTIPAQAKVARLGASGSMTKVKYGTTTGWVNSYFLTGGEPGGTRKPYASPKTYAQGVQNNIAKWCWGVPVATGPGTNGYATMRSLGWGEDVIVEEEIYVGADAPVNSDLSKAIQIHECAHILQYRAYKYDSDALEAAMDRVYPNGAHPGVEHMADCMADAMGAKRTGTFTQDGYMYSYVAGYGGTCSSTQLNAAKKLIAGKKA